jgi:hypothetical protein
MGQDLENKEDLPMPPTPNIVPRFAHYDVDKVLNFYETH